MRPGHILASVLALLLMLVLIAYGATFAPSYQACNAPHSQQSGEQKRTYTDDFIPVAGGSFIDCEAFFANTNGSAITAIATVLLTLVTGGLVILGWHQYTVSRTQMRAHVFAVGYTQIYNPIPQGSFEWRLRPVWQNTGETHTKEMQFHVRCEVRNSELPAGFDFRYPVQTWGAGMMVAKGANPGGIAPAPNQAAISPQDIVDAQMGKKFIYLMGRVIYRDIFPNTPQHASYFCWIVIITGDPNTFVPNDAAHALKFDFAMHSEGNFAEDL